MTLIFDELTTPKVAFSLLDHAGDAISLAMLQALTLTFKDPSGDGDGTVINGRNAQDVKNAHDVTVAANGDVVWQLSVDDTIMLNQLRSQEVRRALFEFVWIDAAAKTQRGHSVIPMLVKSERWKS